MIRTDEEIKQDIVNQLKWDNRVDASNVTVKVDNGEVTLSGKVSSYYALEAARDTTWTVNGVSNVINNITVEIGTEMEAPTDLEIKENIETVLLNNLEINISSMVVSVENGIVTLKGTVDSYWERIHAEDLVSDLPGVIDIINNLAIVPTDDITDETIATDIMDAIERNRYINDKDINIEVENGEVTLNGTVNTQSALNEVLDIVSYTVGVKKIVNNINLDLL